MDSVSATSSAVSASATATYAAQAEAAMRLLKDTLDMQQEIMQQLLASMGIGQNIDIEA